MLVFDLFGVDNEADAIRIAEFLDLIHNNLEDEMSEVTITEIDGMIEVSMGGDVFVYDTWSALLYCLSENGGISQRLRCAILRQMGPGATRPIVKVNDTELSLQGYLTPAEADDLIDEKIELERKVKRLERTISDIRLKVGQDQ